MPDDIVTMSTSESQEGDPTGSIRWEIDNISGLGMDYRHSPELEVQGTKWKLTVKKNEETSTLCVFLTFVKDDSIIRNIDVTAQFTIFYKDFSKNIIRRFEYTFDNTIKDWGFVRIVKWAVITDKKKGFINDSGKITIEAQFTLTSIAEVQIPHLAFAERDIALVIDGKKIYVSKEVLSIHSPVFNAMFYGNFAEKNKEEIELKDIEYEDFIEMLNVIYSTGRRVSDTNVYRLLPLGDRFQIKSIIDESEQILIESTNFTVAAKLKLAGDYRLEELKELCLEAFTTTSELADLENTDEFKEFADPIKVALQEKFEQINEGSRSPSTESDD